MLFGKHLLLSELTNVADKSAIPCYAKSSIIINWCTVCCAERKVATLFYDLASITAVNSLRNICGGVFECFSGISIIFHCVEAH